MPPNLRCRMYEAELPEVDEAVMIAVERTTGVSAYVSLLEYGNLEGMILFSELSRRRFRAVSCVLKVGREEPAIVITVNADKRYVDLSKRRVSEEDARLCVHRYNKSKLVHSIMRNVARTLDLDLEQLYRRIGWPLYRKYGHALDAFKLIVADPDTILDALTYQHKETGPDGQEVTTVVPAVTPEVKDALVKDIRRRMTPQIVKIRADVEMKCFQYDGVLHIKEAMRKAQAAGNTNCPVTIKLVAAPLYVLTTQALSKDQGISVLTDAVNACREAIEKHNGKLVVKLAPRVVSTREDRMFMDNIENLKLANAEVDGDEDSEEGMGDVDVTNAGGCMD